MRPLFIFCYMLVAAHGTAQNAQRSSIGAHQFPTGYTVPEMTRSPDRRYGVLVPDRDLLDWDKEQNRLIDLRTGRTLALIHAHSGAISANHIDIEKPNWSRDSSLLLWRVAGKWEPTALVLIKIRNRQVAWQRNILDVAQKEILALTRRAKRGGYLAAKKENSGNGAAYPGGFTVDVTVGIEPGAPLSLPFKLTATLTSNPKQIESYPKNAEVNSELRGVVTKGGNFRVTRFSLRPPHGESQ